jgi:hypothetical protein
MYKLCSNICKEFVGMLDITTNISRKKETCYKVPSIIVVMGDHLGNSKFPSTS